MSTLAQSRADLRKLADIRLDEARLLLDAGHWCGAYYLAGYAVEIGLKACIIKHLMATDAFPDRQFSQNCYTHRLKSLLQLAGLDETMERAKLADAKLDGYWGIATKWSEELRYRFHRGVRGSQPVRGRFGHNVWSSPMDQEYLVNARLEGGRRLIDSLPPRDFEIEIAFWMKPSDEDKWFLYIASPSIDRIGLGSAYHMVSSILRDAPEWGIDIADVVLVNDQSSMAVDALKQVQKSPQAKTYPYPIPFRGSKLGGAPIQGAYIYSPRTVATAAA